MAARRPETVECGKCLRPAVSRRELTRKSAPSRFPRPASLAIRCFGLCRSVARFPVSIPMSCKQPSDANVASPIEAHPEAGDLPQHYSCGQRALDLDHLRDTGGIAGRDARYIIQNVDFSSALRDGVMSVKRAVEIGAAKQDECKGRGRPAWRCVRTPRLAAGEARENVAPADPADAPVRGAQSPSPWVP